MIDGSGNVYVSTGHGIFKLSTDGNQIWEYPMDAYTINNEPSLMGDTLYLATKTGQAIALDIATGQPRWITKVATDSGGDSGYPSSSDGLFFMACGGRLAKQMNARGGNARVVALNGTTGEQVWEYRLHTPTYNFAPIFPGDGALVFMDLTGGIYRLGMFDGSEIWHTPASDSAKSFSDGGALVGPNSVVYSCSNYGHDHGSEGSRGALRALRLEDGELLWEQILPQACNSWPAVGQLGSTSDLSVVVTPGNFVGSFKIHGSVMAFDASTGKPQWFYQAPLFETPTAMAVGDLEGLVDRHGSICLPAHWGAPIITNDGTIYVGRMDGKLYALTGPIDAGNLEVPSSMDFESTDGVNVETFDAHGASLHGSSAFAPGMMAFATCTDTVFVFKY